MPGDGGPRSREGATRMVGAKRKAQLNPNSPTFEHEYMMRTNQLLTRITWFAAVGMVCTIGLMIAILVLLAGAWSQGDMLTDTSKATMSMHRETNEMRDSVVDYINHIRSQFPANQDVLAARQALGIVESANNILARADFLMQRVDEETIKQLSAHASSIMAKIDTAAGNIDQATVERAKAMVAHMTELVSGISPQQASALVDGLAATTAQLGKLEQEADSVHFVEKSAGLFQEFQSVLHKFNGGEQVAVGFVQPKQE